MIDGTAIKAKNMLNAEKPSDRPRARISNQVAYPSVPKFAERP